MSRQFLSTVIAAAALASTVAIASTIALAAVVTPADQVTMTKADFDRVFADATVAPGPAYTTGVAREQLRRVGRKLLRAASEPEQR